MDPSRFDQVSRALALRSSRRRTIRRLGTGGIAGGLLAAAGFRTAAARAGEETTCTLRFASEVAFGPDEGDQYDGTLTVVIGQDGAIEQGSLKTKGGDALEVVGQANGRSLHLRIQVGDGQVLALIGTAERDVPLCRGRIDGTFGGPRPGDLGSWSAVRSQSNSANGDDEGANENGGNQAPQEPTPTPDPGEGSGGDDCQTGIVCDSQCCTPREGYAPDAISCDGGFCACTYSCASAGCQDGGSDTYFTVGCDDRPDALCGEFCNFPDEEEGDDEGDDEGDGGGGADCVNCGTGCCTAYPGTTAVDFYCQGTACVCYYNCADVCSNGDPNAYFTAGCDQDPGALCANVGCLA